MALFHRSNAARRCLCKINSSPSLSTRSFARCAPKYQELESPTPATRLTNMTLRYHRSKNAPSNVAHGERKRRAVKEYLKSSDVVSSGKKLPEAEPGTDQTEIDALEMGHVGMFVDGRPVKVSALLLRDLCQCPACVDVSTKQKLFNTADIPADITARAVAQTATGASILWDSDLPGYDRSHTTELSLETLRSIASTGLTHGRFHLGEQTLWDAEMFRSQIEDLEYNAYMQDDSVLYKALRQLHTHGLMFLTNVPDSEKSVSTIAERIGPVKNTFYGYTWDVRSVPEAKNVAYTSQDLGFHMDLLYMHQPPHLQFLHCIRSSSVGGASLFTDSYKSAADLFKQDFTAFSQLATSNATFHYNHPSSHLYRQERPVFEMKPATLGPNSRFDRFSDYFKARQGRHHNATKNRIAQQFIYAPENHIEAVNWAPPFQGPFLLNGPPGVGLKTASELLSQKVNYWHAAARKFNALIHRPEAMYERMMKPGDCVLFDNRRVLHARRAFEVGDAGTERWLRGAYLDKDPYVSKLEVLRRQFGDGAADERTIEEMRQTNFFEASERA